MSGVAVQEQVFRDGKYIQSSADRFTQEPHRGTGITIIANSKLVVDFKEHENGFQCVLAYVGVCNKMSLNICSTVAVCNRRSLKICKIM